MCVTARSIFFAKSAKKERGYRMGKRLTIRLSDEEYDVINSVANNLKISNSEVIRNLIYSDMELPFLANISLEKREELLLVLNKTFNELQYMGNNLNQLSKFVNTNKYLPEKTDKFFEHMSSEYKNLNQELVKLWQLLL